MGKKSYWAILFCLGFLTVLLPGRILAVDSLSGVLPTTVSVPSGFQTVPSIIKFLFNFIITVAGTVFVILILIGGIQYLTSAGNEEGTGKAKKLMIDAIIGLILTLSAWAIGTFILGRVGLDQRFNTSIPVPVNNGGGGGGLPNINPAVPSGGGGNLPNNIFYQEGLNVGKEDKNSGRWASKEQAKQDPGSAYYIYVQQKGGGGFVGRSEFDVGYDKGWAN